MWTVGWLAGLSACGGAEPEPDDLARWEAGIIGGQTNTGDPSVVALVAESPNGFSYCTAEVIAPTVLLTAAHCVLGAPGPNLRYGVVTLPNIMDRATALPVSEVHSDPQFDPNRPENGHDIGVAVLPNPIDLPALPFNRAPLSQADVGKSIRLVGYGVANGINGSGGRIKRQVTTVLNELIGPLAHIGVTGQQGCSGDSGGPAFMIIDGVETIIGVTSFGDETCSGGGYYTRLDTYAAFVERFVPAAPPAPEPPKPPAPTPGPPTPPAPQPEDEEGGAPPAREPAWNTETRDEGAAFSGELAGGCTCATPRPGSTAFSGAALAAITGLFFARRRRT